MDKKFQLTISIDELKRGFEARGIKFTEGVFEKSLREYIESNLNKTVDLTHRDRFPTLDNVNRNPCKIVEIDFDANRAVLEPFNEESVKCIRSMVENGTASLKIANLGTMDICKHEDIKPIEDFTVKSRE